MKIFDFDYSLPQELIAQEPSKEREKSRLLAVKKLDGTWQHLNAFSEITEILVAGDLLILNDTKVVPAKLLGKRSTGGKVEVLIIECEKKLAHALVQAARRPKIGESYFFGDYHAQVKRRREKGWELEFDEQVEKIMHERGFPPLPPYIKRKGELLEKFAQGDKQRYQTVYAQHPGAIAAPTAGLHFTSALLQKLERKGVEIKYVTLHVGVATFLPVRCENIEDHIMGKEHYHIDLEVAKAIDDAKTAGRRIIAVGTTSCRTLETAGRLGKVRAGEGESELFIHPPFQFQIVDGLITNFHLPKSTLLLLLSAFAGKDLLMKVYQEAIERKYRFYSYGDAMVIV